MLHSQVHYQWQNGEGDLLVARREEKPNYGDLLTILRDVPGSRVSRSSTNWVDRVRPFLFGVGPGDAVLLPQVGKGRGRKRASSFEGQRAGTECMSMYLMHECSQPDAYRAGGIKGWNAVKGLQGQVAWAEGKSLACQNKIKRSSAATCHAFFRSALVGFFGKLTSWWGPGMTTKFGIALAFRSLSTCQHARQMLSSLNESLRPGMSGRPSSHLRMLGAQKIILVSLTALAILSAFISGTMSLEACFLAAFPCKFPLDCLAPYFNGTAAGMQHTSCVHQPVESIVPL